MGGTPEMVVTAYGHQVSTGAFTFISRAIAKATQEFALGAQPVQALAAGPNAQDFAQALVDAGLGSKKPEKKKVHIALGPLIDKVNLAGLVQSCWPLASAADAAATEIERVRTRVGSMAEPFVFTDVRGFEPAWATVGQEEEDSEDEIEQSRGFLALASAMGHAPKKRARLSVAMWSIAYDKRAIFEAAKQQLSYHRSLEHKEECMKVSHRAKLEKDGHGQPRRPLLGVIYDELARKRWANRAVSGEIGFDVEAAAGNLDEEVLRDAKAEYDAAVARPAKGKGGFDGKGATAANGTSSKQCFTCGKTGHVAADCWKNKQAGAFCVTLQCWCMLCVVRIVCYRRWR